MNGITISSQNVVAMLMTNISLTSSETDLYKFLNGSKTCTIIKNILFSEGAQTEYNAAMTYDVVSMTKETPVYDGSNNGNDGPDNPHVYMPLEDSNPKRSRVQQYRAVKSNADSTLTFQETSSSYER
ncbi:hypothetical protein MAR_021685 [Mya arenaria]|uniref:Uncharacterized protein n=1 Tax=Mya arenaria TaxID=6604 RepID=A0ABY7ECA5_MYAAR|nr:hypothetical protein MAR_021685 [Mya arenaria]